MMNGIRSSMVVFLAAFAILCAACSGESTDGSGQFEVIQQKVTRGEPLTKQEQEAFDNLNKLKQDQKVQEGAPK